MHTARKMLTKEGYHDIIVSHVKPLSASEILGRATALTGGSPQGVQNNKGQGTGLYGGKQIWCATCIKMTNVLVKLLFHDNSIRQF
jgi:hypothetical protein